jgi:hypothetical protein
MTISRMLRWAGGETGGGAWAWAAPSVTALSSEATNRVLRMGFLLAARATRGAGRSSAASGKRV